MEIFDRLKKLRDRIYVKKQRSFVGEWKRGEYFVGWYKIRTELLYFFRDLPICTISYIRYPIRKIILIRAFWQLPLYENERKTRVRILKAFCIRQLLTRRVYMSFPNCFRNISNFDHNILQPTIIDFYTYCE